MDVYGSSGIAQPEDRVSMQANKLMRHLCRTGVLALTALMAAMPVEPVMAQEAPSNVENAAPQEEASQPAVRRTLQSSLSGLRGTTAGTQPATGIEDPFLDGGMEQVEANVDGVDAAAVPVRSPARIQAEEDSAGGKVRPESPEGPVSGIIVNGAPDPRDNVAEAPLQTGSARRPESDPFLPTGFRAGSWNVFVRLEQAIGFTTKTSRAPGGTSGAILETDGVITARSDWSRHEASLEATGSLEKGLSGDAQEIPAAGVTGNLRLDLVDGYTANLRSNYNYSTEATTSNSLGGSVSDRPGVHAYGGSAELLRGGRKLALSVKASADRTTYEQASLDGGGVLIQDDRNNTLYQLTGRAGYELSAAIAPFVQAGIGRRVYDEEADRNGDQRGSTLIDLRTGAAIDLGEKLRGEAAVGYLVENYDGSSLQTLGVASLNGNLVWSPQRGTDVTLSAATALNGSTTAGESGSVSRNFGVSVERQIRDRLSVNAGVAVKVDTFQSGDRDLTTTASVGLEYWINRFLAVTAQLEQERFDSATAGNSWDATTARIGLTLQR